ncbi:hypothetical protein BJ508DRAFT_367659 [Ascobolus immersus RN42]|uniref:Uncharacterized protein n=1 Tax=Ascobolus immersus RN42 TaxID=1160509 RepID=A0A3N4HAX1_ASCIM|nr:hypothetical protein BJ508DRAFT_367659 [Ascobolus immersus RN42]
MATIRAINFPCHDRATAKEKQSAIKTNYTLSRQKDLLAKCPFATADLQANPATFIKKEFLADGIFPNGLWVGRHMANVHTVPYGSGLTIEAIEGRIVDWDPASEAKLAEAFVSTRKRLSQLKEPIKEAGEKLGVL